MKTNMERIKKSYSFFVKQSASNAKFSIKNIAEATGWSVSTVRTYITKKWRSFLTIDDGQYCINPTEFLYSEDEYGRMMSQVQIYSSDPYKPQLNATVESLVQKARDSAILAVDVYNRPMTSFRSQGFTVMMIIAWTSLLHAIFENEGTDYYYRENGNYKTIDGDKKAWELSTCLDNYKQISQPIIANVRMFIILRNKIEHRFSPIFDFDICGECQALLLNFEELITNKFGNYYSLSSTLSIPLQCISAKNQWQYETAKQLHCNHYKVLKKFIESYRETLPDDIYGDMKYSFRVYLIPKIGNHKSSSDLAMEFIKYDPSQPEQFASLEKGITLIKEKRVQVANQGRFKPSQVCQQVTQRLGKPFKVGLHTKAWKFYKVRASGHQADGCVHLYCQYDEPHKDYVYTQEWVDFLVKKLADEDEYEQILSVK